ncbi:hypothetical protein AN214_01892 [Pseudoalteromonas sp. P1-9]|nr:hypothetical protein AN214_01892 [Pseudoalteromonas sp. P1-9]
MYNMDVASWRLCSYLNYFFKNKFDFGASRESKGGAGVFKIGVKIHP